MKNKRKIFIIRRGFSLLTVFLFTAAVTVLGALFFIMPKKEISDVEKRKLTSMPSFTADSLLSGEFTDGLSLYYSDNFAFRDELVKLSFELEDMRGIRYGDVKIYSDGYSGTSDAASAGAKLCVDAPLSRAKSAKTDSASAKIGEEQLPAKPVQAIIKNETEYADITKEDLTGEQRGALFMIGDTALEIFYGNSNVACDYASTINAFRSALPASTRVYDAVVPTHFEFGLPSKYKETVGRREKPFIDDIYSQLDSNIICVDAYSELESHYNKGAYLYFRTDHHWTGLGAYYAYAAFIKDAGFEPIPLEKYETGRIDRFLGTFYSATYDKSLEQNPDYVEYYLPFTEYDMTNYKEDGATTYKGKMIYTRVSSDSDGYLAFMGGDIPLAEIKTQSGTGRSIIIFKESYGNAFIPFLLPHYDEIYVADIRTFPFNSTEFIKEKQITDVLFLNDIMTACTPARVMNIMNLLNDE